MPASRISDRVVEIRFKPNGRILDYRGQWAQAIAEHLKVPEWQITDNRLDVFDKSEARRFFLAFRNCGATIKDAPTETYFLDHAVKFLEFIFAFEPIPKPLVIERIGVRFRSFRGTEADFQTLLKRYTSRAWVFTPAATQAFGGKLLDIGGWLNFKDDLGSYNTISGPMPAEQAKQFLQRDEDVDYPKTGVFMDCDYWLKPDAPGTPMVVTEIVNTVRRFSERAASRVDAVYDLLVAED